MKNFNSIISSIKLPGNIVPILSVLILELAIAMQLHSTALVVSTIPEIVFILSVLFTAVFVFLRFPEKLKSNGPLLLAIFFNSASTLILQDIIPATSVIIIDISISLIYMTLIFLSLGDDEGANIQKLLLIVVFTGFAYLYTLDFKTTIIYFAVILLINLIATIIFKNFEENSPMLLPFVSRFNLLNRIFVNRYYYSVRFLDILNRFLVKPYGKFLFFFFWVVFQLTACFIIGVPGLSIIAGQLFANILLSASYSCYSLARHPLIKSHTEKNLTLIKREYFTDGFKRIFSKETLQVIAFSGTFGIPWVGYTWIVTRRDQCKVTAAERLETMTEEMKQLAPEWKKEMEFQMQFGYPSANYNVALQQWFAALSAKKPDQNLEKENVNYLLGQLVNKDQEIANKDQEIANKDQQIKNLLAKIANNDINNGDYAKDLVVKLGEEQLKNDFNIPTSP